MGRLFGTDGARGVANKELTCELAMQIGRAAAMVLAAKDIRRPRVMIGKDTRMSSDMLESAIAAGFCSVGADVLLLGVVPTPAVAYLVREKGYDAGVMISASHNPCEYNGIKIFKSDGYKLPDAVEEQIEQIILDEAAVPPVRVGGDVGTVRADPAMREEYIRHVYRTSDFIFADMHIALDCANGSAAYTAPKLFADLGAQCDLLAAEPDGVNINRDCGSTHLQNLQKYVREHQLDAGFAFDGDADRLLCVDGEGNIVDGDRIMCICASDLKARGKLKNDTLVVTVMSNMGLQKYCAAHGIRTESTKVGDRYVLENMLQNGNVLGGEQSGHVIFLDYANTGDGQLTAVQVLNVMKRTGRTLASLASEMEVFPQIMQNVRVSNMGKIRLATDPEVQAAIAESEKELGESGRVLVRVSGTEPLVRVMLEGKDRAQIEKLCGEIAEVVRERLI